MMPAETEFEFNVIAGYRFLGVILTLAPVLSMAVILSANLKTSGGRPLPPETPLLALPLLLCGLACLFGVSRVRASARSRELRTARGVWPFVSRRTIDASDVTQFRIGATRAKQGVTLKVDLVRASGERPIPLLRNASQRSMRQALRLARAWRVPVELHGAVKHAPKWLNEDLAALRSFGRDEREAL